MRTSLIRDSLLLFLLAAALLLAAGQGLSADSREAPRLIDDFEDGDLDAVPGLSWIVFADDLVGGGSTGQIALVEPGAAGSRKALRLQSQIGEDFRAPFAGVWTAAQADGLPADLSAYQGIRFHAKGRGGTFRVGLRCGQGASSMNFVKSFDTPQEWTAFTVPFSELEPQGKTEVQWAPQLVSWVGFSTTRPTPGEVELQIDQVELY
jgi:hypothetical protein